MPIARWTHDVIRTTALALVGFALLRIAANRAPNFPGLKAAVGAGGLAQ